MSGRNLMRLLVAVVAIGAVISTTWFISPVWAADEDKKPAQPGAPSAEQMAMYDKMAQPGPEHDRLKQMVGTWDAEVKMFGMDGKEAGPATKGTMKGEMILGGRFLQLKYEGMMAMGPGEPKPFHGMGLSGYDKGKKKYTNVWIDEMSTGFMTTEGTCDGNVMTSMGEFTDPMSGQPMKVKEVATHVDDSHAKYEMYMSMPDGSMMKMMEISYTKRA